MSDHKDVKLSLKVMINKQKNKVLFAEADSDFADILLSFLTLPLGTVIKLLKKQYAFSAPVIGSLTTLYNGLANLDSAYFWTDGGKQMLLNPRNSFGDECNKLKLNVDDTQPANYFRCAESECKSKKRTTTVSMYYNTTKCDCGKYMSKAMGPIESPGEFNGDDGGVFTEKGATFLITDDLKMAPVVPGTIIQTLINLEVSIADGGGELMTVTLGLNDIIYLLRGALLSNTPLTDLILHKRHTTTYVTGDLPLHMVGESLLSSSRKMTVKAWVQESSRTLLLVQAEEDFVDFLFSLLVIPLGAVEGLLGSNTSFRSIDNLYRSIENFILDECFSTMDMKRRLMKPELPPNYLSKNCIFSLSEQINPNIYCFEKVSLSPDYTVEKGFWMRVKDPKGDGSYVRRPETFIVTCNLIVLRNSVGFVSDMMNEFGSDVKELELHIGLEEALNILKASLTSNYALKDGLYSQILEKLPLQER